MKKQLRKLSVWAGLLILCTLLLFASALAEDPLQFKMEVTPDTLTGPATVRVSINIINMSDDGTPISVTLSDPDGKVCSTFGSGGTANLAPGASQSYSGSWTVTAAQLEAGKIIYSARYSIMNESGQPVSANRPISKAIKYNQATAKLDAKRSVSPSSTVMEGQTVTISYHLANSGTIDISNIIIKDPAIFDGQVTYPLLKVGESTDLSYHFTAETSSKTSDAEITYSYQSGTKTETKTGKGEPLVINVTVPDVSVKLTASQVVVNAGDKVDLICTITNKSNLAYEQIKITDLILNDIDSGITIGAGKTHEVKKSITVSKTGTYQFTVKGIDSTGGSVTFESNSVTITTTDDPSIAGTIEAIPLDLDITIEADREVIYSEPSDIIFQIKVTNFGTTDVNNVVVAAKSHKNKDIRTIEKIEPGETVDFTQALSASMGGKYVFTVTAKDNTGEEFSKDSNPIQVTFTATQPPPTPTPAPTIAPTEPQPPATEPTQDITSPFGNESDQGSSPGTILLYALAGLLFVILLAVVLLFVLDRRRNSTASSSGGSGPVAVIDSIQRSPHRDYARAPKRSPSTGRRDSKKKEKGKDEPPVSVYAPSPEDPYEDDLSIQASDVASKPNSAGAYEDSVYRRPVTVRSEIKSFDVDGEETTGSPDESHSNEYLSRIRGASPAKQTDETEEKPANVEPASTMSDEEAALLSGSTGQYRLSRHSVAVRPSTQATAKVEDAESFTRKQRAARSSRTDLSNFYDDDEEEAEGEDPPKAARHRRR